MPLFPIFANLENREVLVIGGGDIAQRKIEALLKAGACVRVHAREFNAQLTEWQGQGRLQRLPGTFDMTWLEEVWLVVAATDDRAFNREIAREASKRRLLINVVDDAELSTFHVPAIVDREPLQIAISSGGSAPMLARRLRERLETDLDESLGTLASMFSANREAIRRQFPDLAQRRRWFDHVLDGPTFSLLQQGQAEKAAGIFLESLMRGVADINVEGRIIVVDASHSDPGLLTLKAQRALNSADLLVCDVGVSRPVLERARRDANRIDAPEVESELADLLIGSAQKGLCVVFLDGANQTRKTRLALLRRECDRLGIACIFLASPISH